MLLDISKVAMDLMGDEYKELWNVPSPEWHRDYLCRLGYKTRWTQQDRDLVGEEWTLRQLKGLQKVVEDYAPKRIYNCTQTSVKMKDGETGKVVREASVMMAASADGINKLPLWFFTKSSKPYTSRKKEDLIPGLPEEDQMKLPLVIAESADTKKLIKHITTAQNKSSASDTLKAKAKASATNALYHKATVADANVKPITEDGLNVRCVVNKTGYMDSRTMCLWLMLFARETKASKTNPVLLIMDNIWFHDHARRIVQDWPELEGVRVEFLPKNSTSYTQPFDLGVVDLFKSRAKDYENDLRAKLTRVDGSEVVLTQLQMLNCLDKAWTSMSKRCLANYFKKSPVFYFHDKFRLTLTSQANLQAYEKEQQELAEGKIVEEEEPDRFTVTGPGVLDTNGDTAIFLGEAEFVRDEELEDGVGGDESGKWYFFAPNRLRPPTAMEILEGLTLDDLYEGGREKLLKEYDFIFQRKKEIDIEKAESPARKREAELARIEREEGVKRARDASMFPFPFPDQVEGAVYPTTLEDSIDDSVMEITPDIEIVEIADTDLSDDDNFHTPPASPSKSVFEDPAPPTNQNNPQNQNPNQNPTTPTTPKTTPGTPTRTPTRTTFTTSTLLWRNRSRILWPRQDLSSSFSLQASS
ncbi:hypothetical protein CJU90_4790 [Yarrowia sp. C11]|nr:hypothetical protein CJU90_4790 [Yarrowia sp. C11]